MYHWSNFNLEVLEHRRPGLQPPGKIVLRHHVVDGVNGNNYTRQSEHGGEDAAVGWHEHQGRQQPGGDQEATSIMLRQPLGACRKRRRMMRTRMRKGRKEGRKEGRKDGRKERKITYRGRKGLVTRPNKTCKSCKHTELWARRIYVKYSCTIINQYKW